MLGKLMKYEFKAINPILIIMHAFTLLAALLLRVFVTGRIFREGVDFEDPRVVMPAVLFTTLFVIALSLVLFATELIIAVRFYKNLFSGEGYLTLTLPVTPGQHLLSRTISGTVWGVLDMCLVFLAGYITFATPFVKEEFRDAYLEFQDLLALSPDVTVPSPAVFILFCIVYCVIGVAANILVTYASVAVGQVLFGHRAIGAVAVYFVINTVFSLVTFLALALSGNMNLFFDPDGSSAVTHVKSSILLSGWLSVGTLIVLYLITYYVMKKKINMD